MNKHKVGLTVSIFAGVAHLGWSVLVMLGLAQPLYNWVHGLHAIESSAVVGSMGVGGLITLVVSAMVVGYAAGWLFTAVWNKVNG